VLELSRPGCSTYIRIKLAKNNNASDTLLLLVFLGNNLDSKKAAVCGDITNGQSPLVIRLGELAFHSVGILHLTVLKVKRRSWICPFYLKNSFKERVYPPSLRSGGNLKSYRNASPTPPFTTRLRSRKLGRGAALH
jgi:hypothetical protein